ncbi:MAG: hypothetical protein ACR2KZ_16735, partial [Segetibacter sp.]
FKMSGNDNYVEGKEADIFFNSIKIRPLAINISLSFEPVQGGFKVNFPQPVNEAYNRNTPDGTGRWEYESTDDSNGSAYMVWKKSLYNFNFIEEDTFDLSLINESFKSSEIIDKQIWKKTASEKNIPFVEGKFSLKGGSYITTKAFLKGPHYYLLAVRSKDGKADFSKFFNSFQFTDFKYPKPEKYIDSTLKIEVLTSVKPNVDYILRSWLEKSGSDPFPGAEQSYTGAPKNKTGIFKSDSTGESILVTVQDFPKYYYSSDSAKFWRDKLELRDVEKDMVFRKKEFFKINDSTCGYNVVLTDTNSSRCIRYICYLKGSSLYKFSTLSDTTTPESVFVKTFFATARPIDKNAGPSIFNTKLDVFFTDYTSKDSSTTKYASEAISGMYFGKDGVQKIMDAIDRLRVTDKDYFEIKSRFITELGYIKDASISEKLVHYLRELYDKSADTSYFQNRVLSALARLQTKESYDLLKKLLEQDLPIFDDAYEYGRFFSQFSDTLSLAKTLFPEILQLASLEDYKPYVNELLKTMVDSGRLTADDYNSYFSKLYFDARIELKKQQNKDEKLLEASIEGRDIDNDESDYRSFYAQSTTRRSTTTLADFATLLMPFYDKYPTVPKYFQKLLQSKDVGVQLAAAKLLLENDKKVPDSIFASIAASDKYRARLYSMLNKMNKVQMFPAKYKKQEMIAKSLLLNDKRYKEFAAIEMVDKTMMEIKGVKGNVYLFKYKVKPTDDWKIGISGLQPLNTKAVNTSPVIVKLTEKKLKLYESETEQFDEQIKRVLFAQHKSGRRFFERSNSLGFLNNNFSD